MWSDVQPDPDARRRVGRFFYVFCVLAFIVSPFLLGYSFCKVTPGYVGVLHNKNTNDLDFDTLFGEGRHYCGLGRRIITFPTFLNNVEHTTPTRTQDGLGVSIVSSFQYKLKTDLTSLKALYTTFGENYQPAFGYMVEAALRDVVSQYDAKDLVEDRDNFADDVELASNQVVSPFYAEVVAVQLLNVDWHERVDAAIMETVVALEDVNTATEERNVAMIGATTDVGQAKILAQNVVAQAEQEAELTKAKKKAEAVIISQQGVSQAGAFKTIKGTTKRRVAGPATAHFPTPHRTVFTNPPHLRSPLRHFRYDVFADS